MSQEDRQEQQADTMISVHDAYLALYYFINAYWERGKRREGSVTLLLTAVRPLERAESTGAVETNDSAMWGDWLDAVETARSQGYPEEL
jgi:hypothetical protein